VPLVGPGLIVAGVLHGVRLARWRGAGTTAEPLLLVLHVAYGWLAVGLALLGAAAGSVSCLALAFVALGLRIGLYKSVQQSFGFRRRDYWLLPITDLMAFCVFIWSFFGTSVTWKRASYTVLGDGRMAQSH